MKEFWGNCWKKIGATKMLPIISTTGRMLTKDRRGFKTDNFDDEISTFLLAGKTSIL